MSDVTRQLAALQDGEGQAFDHVYTLLYAELHKLAHARVRRSGELTLIDTTSLVHEAYLRFGRSQVDTFRDRSHFLGYAAQVMRSIVVDAVRRRQATMHGGQATHEALDDERHDTGTLDHDREVMRIHESLGELAAIDERLVKVVEMRYFAGMTETETAIALGVAVRTVARDWEKARLFLHASLR